MVVPFFPLHVLPRSNGTGYQINLLPLSTRPENRTNVELRIHLSAPSCHDGPAWPCTGALCPCTAANHRESISACQYETEIAHLLENLSKLTFCPLKIGEQSANDRLAGT